MPSLLLHGNYSPNAWRDILKAPEIAPTVIEDEAQKIGARLFGYWFSFDNHDFYSVIDGESILSLVVLRHRLFGMNVARSLNTEALFAPDEVVDEILGTQRGSPS